MHGPRVPRSPATSVFRRISYFFAEIQHIITVVEEILDNKSYPFAPIASQAQLRFV